MLPTDQAICRSFPVSFAQERIWFLDQLDPHAATFNIPVAFRLAGPLNLDALERSIQDVIARHDALRTTFHDTSGVPVQVVHRDSRFVMQVFTMRGLNGAARESAVDHRMRDDARRPFDLGTGPLLRVTVLLLAPTEHVLLVTLHHIVGDGASLVLMLREIAALYAARLRGEPIELTPLPVQYGDFAVWQREKLEGDAQEPHLRYWREQLDGLSPVLMLPTDRPRLAVSRHRGARHACAVPRELLGKITAFSRQERVTPFIVVMAAYQALLSRYSGQDDFAVVVPFANHANRPAMKVESVIGLFASTLVLRSDLRGFPSFRELLLRVRKTAMAAHAHQEVDFHAVVKALQPERSAGQMPFFRAMLNVLDPWEDALGLPGIEVTEIQPSSVACQCDLTLLTSEREGALSLTLEYDADLFDRSTIERIGEHLVRLLEEGLEQPDRVVCHAPMLSVAERHQLLVEWNDTSADSLPDVCIHQLFEAQADRTPDAVAVVYGEERLTYQALNQQANQLAQYLRKLGAGPEIRVGLCLDRTPQMLVAILGILKAGAAYVPLDPTYPAERLRFILEDAQAHLLVTQERLGRELFSGRQAFGVVCLDTDSAAIAAAARESSAPDVGPNNLSYVIYTSGSTGKPKGVAIEHRSPVALVEWARGVFSPKECAGVLCATSVCFDLSIFEIFVPLSVGGTIILASDVLQLPMLPAAQHVTLVNTVPSAMNALVRLGALPPSVQTVTLAGEPLGDELVRDLYRLPHVRSVIDLYGPSETTTYSTYALRRADGPITIGRPIANTRIYVLDRHGEPVPVGVPGEVCIAGAGVARGYLNRPDLTAQQFVADPFAGDHAARMYRTGDLARYLPDGNLTFLGRMDHQVKLRGYRIELGEVESVVRECPGVGTCAVAMRPARDGDLRLVAYVVAKNPREPVAVGALLEFLRQTLPGYMVPSLVVSLDALPLTPSGKVDRKALPPPGAALANTDRGQAISYRTPVEEIVARIWTEVLNVKNVGVHDNFFALGGHSLIAARVASRIRQAFGVDVPLRMLFEYPTVASLAARLELIRTTPLLPPLLPAGREHPLPLSFAQERLWFLDALEPESVAYTLAQAYRLSGPLAVDVLERSLKALIARHEALRTAFEARGGDVVQVIGPAAGFRLRQLDLSELDDGAREAEMARAVADVRQMPFDLASSPLVRALLVRLNRAEHVLLLHFHHIACDAWSVGVFCRELSVIYAALNAEQPPILPELPIQYADYARWQRAWLEGDELARQTAYWHERLANLPALELPTDRPRPPRQSYSGGVHAFSLSPELAGALNAFNSRENVTAFMSLLAAFQVLLSRYSGQEDVSVGVPIANRHRGEVEHLIGCLINTLVMRTDLGNGAGFREVAARVRQSALDAYEHQDLPFEKLVEDLNPKRDLGRHPLFQVMFVLQNAPHHPLTLPGVDVSDYPLPCHSTHFDLELHLWEEGGTWCGLLFYSVDLFDATTMARMAGHYETLLEGMLREPDRPVFDVPMVPDSMVPSDCATLERLPLMPCGQIDRPVLPAVEEARETSGTPRVPPCTSLERTLCGIWATVLDVQEVGLHDNFFDLGGHSLQAVKAVWAIQEHLHRKVPVAALISSPTVAQLARFLSAKDEGASIEPLSHASNRNHEPPLFFVPSINGFEFLPRIVAGRMGEEFRYFDGLQYPGLGGEAPPSASVEVIARNLIDQIRRVWPTGPYRLAGHSFGGVLAFEIARQMEAAGMAIELLLMWDSFAPRGWTKHRRSNAEVVSAMRRRLFELDLRARPAFLWQAMVDGLSFVGRRLIRRVRRATAGPIEPAKTPDAADVACQVIPPGRAVRKSSITAYKQYRPATYPGRAVLLRASTRPANGSLRYDVRIDPFNGWGALVLGGLEVRDIPGDHMSLLAEPAASMVADVTLECLRRLVA